MSTLQKSYGNDLIETADLPHLDAFNFPNQTVFINGAMGQDGDSGIARLRDAGRTSVFYDAAGDPGFASITDVNGFDVLDCTGSPVDSAGYLLEPTVFNGTKLTVAFVIKRVVGTNRQRIFSLTDKTGEREFFRFEFSNSVNKWELAYSLDGGGDTGIVTEATSGLNRWAGYICEIDLGIGSVKLNQVAFNKDPQAEQASTGNATGEFVLDSEEFSLHFLARAQTSRIDEYLGSCDQFAIMDPLTDTDRTNLLAHLQDRCDTLSA